MTKQPTAGPDREADLSAELQVAFGESVRTQRIAAGMTQVDLARASGIVQGKISMIEDGKFNLTLRTMSRLASVLEGDVAQMLRNARGAPKG